MRMSIGQALGIKTAGDRLRAAERAAVRRGRKRGVEQGVEQERKKNEAASLARDAKMAEYLRSIGVSDENVATMLAIK
ncbi:hypothetical protein [Fibrobacter sp.]|uniref:hypothetical protein n=1 Tax=Fibrobacter sp. TaxID=35828 RepID=UPI003867F1FE